MTSLQPPALPELLAHTRWVEELARSLVRDPEAARDLAQSTLLAALEQSGERPGNLRAWLGRVLRNQARERWRREAARSRVETSGARAEALPATDELVLRAECERRVVEAVLALEEPHRSTLLLRYFEGLAPAEIARRSNAPLATVTRRITRAHAHLREKLSRDRDGASWTLAITPLLQRLDVGASSAPLVPGVLLMSASVKVVLGVAALGLLVWFLRPHAASAPELARNEPAPAPPVDAPAIDTSNVPATEPRRPAETSSAVPAPSPAAVAVPAPAPTSPTAVPTAQGGRIYGRVFRPDAQPAPKRRVRMLRMSQGPEKFATTDEDGRFDERDLGAGVWSLSTWPDKVELEALGQADEDTLNGMVYMTQSTVDLEPGGEIEVVLGKATADSVIASGRLLQDGKPVAGYMTWLPDGRDAMDRQRLATATAEKGYEARLDAPGRYLVVAIQDEARVELVVDVPRGPTFVHDLELPPAELRGRVATREGAPVAGAKVDLTPRAAHLPRHPSANIQYSRTSDAQGAFTFRCLPAARYALGVHGGTLGADKQPATATAIADVDLRSGKSDVLEVVVGAAAENARARGTVSAREGSVAYTFVFVCDEVGEPLNPIDGITAGKDGSFELFPLAPGRYFAVGACGDRWSPSVRFVVPSQGETPPIVLPLARAARITVETHGPIDPRDGGPVWIDLRDANGCCLSALLDKHVFNRAVNRDWSSSSFTYYAPAGSYDVRAAGAAERSSARVEAVAGEEARVVLGR